MINRKWYEYKTNSFWKGQTTKINNLEKGSAVLTGCSETGRNKPQNPSKNA